MEQTTLFDDLVTRLPHKPYYTDDFAAGLRIADVAYALQHRYIQPNPPTIVYWIVQDLDYDDSELAYWEAGIAPPNFSVMNTKNGHSHYFYGFQTPIQLNDHHAYQKAIRLLGAVDNAMCHALNADQTYGGLIAKNPTHNSWQTRVHASEYYTLSDLSMTLDLGKYKDKRKRLPNHGFGRNCTLFDRLRHWSYGQARAGRREELGWNSWLSHIQAQASFYNTFDQRLSEQEVGHIAKSVAKWVFTCYTGRISDDQFSQIQAHRGKQKGAEQRREKLDLAMTLYRDGMSKKAISEKLDVPRKTLTDWISKYSDNQPTERQNILL